LANGLFRKIQGNAAPKKQNTGNATTQSAKPKTRGLVCEPGASNIMGIMIAGMIAASPVKVQKAVKANQPKFFRMSAVCVGLSDDQSRTGTGLDAAPSRAERAAESMPQ
jgi:hypothetical protein